jgi:hypothetical protein
LLEACCAHVCNVAGVGAFIKCLQVQDIQQQQTERPSAAASAAAAVASTIAVSSFSNYLQPSEIIHLQLLVSTAAVLNALATCAKPLNCVTPGRGM